MNTNKENQIRQAIETHKKAVSNFEAGSVETIAAAAEIITEAIKNGGKICICGNGGSAADAQHIAAELVGRFKRERKAIAAIALTTNSSTITAIANDYKYEDVFSRQVEALVQKNDVLWAISTSGNSANVVAAAESAKQKGAKILAFTGKSGSKLEKIADVCLCTDEKITAHSQEIHQLSYHIICDLVEQEFCKQ